jgi:NADPH:quinone reductase-like Zn-dependent oxidoreductase
MRAYALDEFGKPGTVRDRPDPTPGEGQVLIKVKAAGLNAFDVTVINGYAKNWMEHRFPLIPGNDVSGVIEALGPGVTTLAVGDEVFGSQGKPYQGEGTVAEYVAAAADNVVPKPDFLDHTEAAAIPVAGLTALQAIDRIDPGPGDTIVVLGATGGVGSYFVPLAAARDAHVIAVTRPEYADYARELGATDVIDYTAGHPADLLRPLAPEGIAALVDFFGDADLVLSLADQVTTGGWAISAAGGVKEELLEKFSLQGGPINAAPKDRLTELTQTLQNLPRPAIRTYPLHDAADAFAEQATRHVRGKLVVTND